MKVRVDTFRPKRQESAAHSSVFSCHLHSRQYSPLPFSYTIILKTGTAMENIDERSGWSI